MWLDTKALVLFQMWLCYTYNLDDLILIFLLIFYSHKDELILKF